MIHHMIQTNSTSNEMNHYTIHGITKIGKRLTQNIEKSEKIQEKYKMLRFQNGYPNIIKKM